MRHDIVISLVKEGTYKVTILDHKGNLIDQATGGRNRAKNFAKLHGHTGRIKWNIICRVYSYHTTFERKIQ